MANIRFFINKATEMANLELMCENIEKFESALDICADQNTVEYIKLVKELNNFETENELMRSRYFIVDTGKGQFNKGLTKTIENSSENQLAWLTTISCDDKFKMNINCKFINTPYGIYVRGAEHHDENGYVYHHNLMSFAVAYAKDGRLPMANHEQILWYIVNNINEFDPIIYKGVDKLIELFADEITYLCNTDWTKAFYDFRPILNTASTWFNRVDSNNAEDVENVVYCNRSYNVNQLSDSNKERLSPIYNAIIEMATEYGFPYIVEDPDAWKDQQKENRFDNGLEEEYTGWYDDTNSERELRSEAFYSKTGYMSNSLGFVTARAIATCQFFYGETRKSSLNKLRNQLKHNSERKDIAELLNILPLKFEEAIHYEFLREEARHSKELFDEVNRVIGSIKVAQFDYNWDNFAREDGLELLNNLAFTFAVSELSEDGKAVFEGLEEFKTKFALTDGIVTKITKPVMFKGQPTSKVETYEISYLDTLKTFCAEFLDFFNDPAKIFETKSFTDMCVSGKMYGCKSYKYEESNEDSRSVKGASLDAIEAFVGTTDEGFEEIFTGNSSENELVKKLVFFTDTHEAARVAKIAAVDYEGFVDELVVPFIYKEDFISNLFLAMSGKEYEDFSLISLSTCSVEEVEALEVSLLN